jgi:hypothetical protein
VVWVLFDWFVGVHKCSWVGVCEGGGQLWPWETHGIDHSSTLCCVLCCLCVCCLQLLKKGSVAVIVGGIAEMYMQVRRCVDKGVCMTLVCVFVVGAGGCGGCWGHGGGIAERRSSV